jgi:hypothetical protein
MVIDNFHQPNQSFPNLRYFLEICLQGLTETPEISVDSRSPAAMPSEYKSEKSFCEPIDSENLIEFACFFKVFYSNQLTPCEMSLDFLSLFLILTSFCLIIVGVKGYCCT